MAAPDPPPSFRRSWRTRAWRLARLTPFLAIVAAYYVFIVSAGHWTQWPTWTAFYEDQVQGFLQGHLYLPIAAPAGLAALTDPLDPKNMRFWRWDRSYYHGHFYLYWGLVPAVLTTVAKLVFQVRRAVTDDVIVFVCLLGRLLAGTLLLRELAARMPVRPAAWAVWLALVVFAVAHPTPYLLNRGGVYEAAITAGAGFMIAGLYLALRGIFAEEGREANLWLMGSSLSLGCAGGSRSSVLPAVALLIAFTIFVRSRIDRAGRRGSIRTTLAAGGPAAAVTMAHFLLNRLRYDAWTEFGARYQMGYPPFKVGPRFLVPDLYTYLFGRYDVSCVFPFVTSAWDSTRKLAPGWLSWPADHHTSEPTVGVFRAVPFLWLIVIAAVGAALWRWDPRRASRPAPVADLDWRWRWVRGALWIYALVAGAPLVLLSATTMRYEADFMSGLLVIAILAGWQLLVASGPRNRRLLVTAAYVLLAALTILLGMLLGIGGYFDQFGRHNHALLVQFQHLFNVCAARGYSRP